MANRQISFSITARTQRLEKNLSKAQKTLSNFSRKAKRTGRTLTQNLSLPILAIGGASLKSAADFETLEQSLIALNGSAEEGRRIFEKLKEFSANTPFQLKDLADTQKTLQGFGLAADDAFSSLQQIGDIAAITGSNIGNVAIAFGQAAAEGRVMTRDIRQFINNGIPMTKLLAESMGVAQSEIFDLASAGKISFKDLQKAFAKTTAEGGKFYKGTEKQANTLWGVWSNFRDNMNIALGEIGKSIAKNLDLKKVAKQVVGKIQSMTETFNNFSETTKKRILSVAGVLAIGGPFLSAVGYTVAGISKLIGAFKVLTLTWIPRLLKALRGLTAYMAANPLLAMGAFLAYAGVKGYQAHEAVEELNKSVDELTKKDLEDINADKLYTTLAGLQERLNKMKEAAKGENYDVEDMAGYDRVKQQIKTLTKLWNDLNVSRNKVTSTSATPTKQGSSSSSVSSSANINPNYGSENPFDTKGISVTSPLTDKDTEKYSSNIGTMIARTQMAKDKISAFGAKLRDEVGPVITNGLSDIGASFVDMSIKSAAAGNSFGGVMKALLSSLGDLAIRVGKIAIATGIAIEGIKKSLQSLNPIAAIAAGGALIALGYGVKSALSNAGGSSGSSGGGGGSIAPSQSPSLSNRDASRVFLSNISNQSQFSIQKAFERALSNAKLRADGDDLVLAINNNSYLNR